ncbi:hypothetical protein FACS1894113_5640 [Alphaproteobacteria bacterium]|nr:hypothetical protein FACS1894113_5640 [Alphaproteobacteria bacterium]
MNNIDVSKEIMAKTMFGEARGEYRKYGINSIIAIGSVIMNRVAKSGKSIEDICLKPLQFSCWNESDPNRSIIDNISENDEVYTICLDAAEGVISQKIEDVTNGADHYYSTKLKPPPTWSYYGNVTAFIGNHVFLKI